MIDNGMFVVHTSEVWNKGGNLPFEYCDVLYDPEYRKGELFRFKGRLKNLIVLVYPDRVVLKNSIHKYWHGNNYSDFTTSEFIDAINEICSLTGLNWWESHVKSIEYGCNLYDIDTNGIINSFKAYKRKDYYPMVYSGKKYGIKAEMQEFSIKGYDKTFEVKHHDKITLPQSIFRWECCVKKPVYFKNRKIPISTVRDLIDLSVLETLVYDLVDKFTKSIRIPSVNLSGMPVSDKKILAYMNDDIIRTNIKVSHPDTYKKDLYKFKKITQTADVDNEGILSLINNKCLSLIAA